MYALSMCRIKGCYESSINLAFYLRVAAKLLYISRFKLMSINQYKRFKCCYCRLCVKSLAIALKQIYKSGCRFLI